MTRGSIIVFALSATLGVTVALISPGPDDVSPDPMPEGLTFVEMAFHGFVGHSFLILIWAFIRGKDRPFRYVGVTKLRFGWTEVPSFIAAGAILTLAILVGSIIGGHLDSADGAPLVIEVAACFLSLPFTRLVRPSAYASHEESAPRGEGGRKSSEPS